MCREFVCDSRCASRSEQLRLYTRQERVLFDRVEELLRAKREAPVDLLPQEFLDCPDFNNIQYPGFRDMRGESLIPILGQVIVGFNRRLGRFDLDAYVAREQGIAGVDWEGHTGAESRVRRHVIAPLRMNGRKCPIEIHEMITIEGRKRPFSHISPGIFLGTSMSSRYPLSVPEP